jgi:glycerophosphoryl diester phosphodiesterase
VTSDPAPFRVLSGGPLLIGHRGAAGLAPENTMPSFRDAAERWAVDMIELDVRASADGRCMVIHDDTVDRTTDGTGPVAEKTLAELKELDAGYRFTDERGGRPFRGRGITIPTLEEVLEAFPGMRFTIEVKIGTAQEPMFEVIDRLMAGDRVVAAGMDAADRTMFDDFDGPVSGSTRDVRAFLILHRLRLARLWRRSADVFQVPEHTRGIRIVTPRFVRDARARGVPVHVWTVNDASDMRRLLGWGVDGLITDRPDRGAEVLHEHAGRPLPVGGM